MSTTSTSRFSIDFLLNGEDKDPEMIVQNPSSNIQQSPLDSSSNSQSKLQNHQQFLDFHFRQLQEYQKHWQQLTQQRPQQPQHQNHHQQNHQQSQSPSVESLDSVTSLPSLINKPIIASESLNKNNSSSTISSSSSGNPLDCLAQASLFSRNPSLESPQGTMNLGLIKIVDGPLGPSVQLHRDGSGTLPSTLSKLVSMKCKNRECNNLCGQINKPRSIYCSKRCQSREQNLRQGRIKNAKKNGKVDSLPVIGSVGMKSSSLQSPASTMGNNRAVLSPIQQRSIELQLVESLPPPVSANSLLTSIKNPSQSASSSSMSSFRPVIPQMKPMMNPLMHNSFASLVNATTSLMDDEEHPQSSLITSTSSVPRTPSPQNNLSKQFSSSSFSLSLSSSSSEEEIHSSIIISSQ